MRKKVMGHYLTDCVEKRRVDKTQIKSFTIFMTPLTCPECFNFAMNQQSSIQLSKTIITLQQAKKKNTWFDYLISCTLSSSSSAVYIWYVCCHDCPPQGLVKLKVFSWNVNSVIIQMETQNELNQVEVSQISSSTTTTMMMMMMWAWTDPFLYYYCQRDVECEKKLYIAQSLF